MRLDRFCIPKKISYPRSPILLMKILYVPKYDCPIFSFEGFIDHYFILHDGFLLMVNHVYLHLNHRL